MAKLNYTQVERAIRNREEFEGNSCQGFYEDGEYVVLSYATRIAVVAGAERGGELWLNPNKYSQTTSRLQNIIKRAWGVVMSEYEKVDNKYFEALQFGDDFCDAEIYPNSVWQKYQELLEEIRQTRAGLK